jgi:hypothetical protein
MYLQMLKFMRFKMLNLTLYHHSEIFTKTEFY